MSTATYARRYCELGLKLTWTQPGVKGPRHPGWNLPEKAIGSSDLALQHWTQNPNHGVAALLSPSGLVSLDIDELLLSRRVLTVLDVDLDGLAAHTPRIEGRPETFRLMFKAPAAELKHRSAKWPKQDDPRKSFVLFELRAGAIADTLPPTIHPKTGQPYRWAIPPRNGFPALPDRLLELWQDWPATERAVLACCPWWIPPTPQPRAAIQPRRADTPSVIAEFNARHDVAEVLEANGYIRRGKRFASPDTRHAAGVVLLDGGRVYCHHAGDPLGSGKALDAFDVYTQLVHNGNMRAAVRTVADALGMRQGA